MKATGIVRMIDDLGRVVIPAEIRMCLDWGLKERIEFFTDDDTVVLRKLEYRCAICGSSKELVTFKGKKVCVDCMEGLKVV